MTLQSRPCHTGDLILRSKPFVKAVSESYRLILCNHCFKRCEHLLRCTACSVIRYCGRSCQKEDWKLHKQECPLLKKYAPKVPTESVRLFLRLILKHRDGETTTTVEEGLGGKRCFNDLMSHLSEVKQDDKRMKQFISMCEGLKHHLEFDLGQFSVGDLLEIFGRMNVNSFSICDMEMQAVGVGVYLLPSKLDHSCEPNAVVTFRGTELHLRSTESLCSSTEIRISYIDQLNTPTERRQQLKEQYYFTCKCSRCEDNKQENKMLSSTCPTKRCDGHVVEAEGAEELVCDKCGLTRFTPDFLDRRKKATAAATDALGKLKDLKKQNDDGGIIRVCKGFKGMWSGVLHLQNIYVTHLFDHEFDAHINLNQWEDALRCAQNTISSYRIYYPPFHPALGIQLMKIGKIHLHLNNHSESLKYLQQAEEILLVTYGKDSQLFIDLKHLQLQCQNETMSVV